MGIRLVLSVMYMVMYTGRNHDESVSGTDLYRPTLSEYLNDYQSRISKADIPPNARQAFSLCSKTFLFIMTDLDQMA